VWLLIVWRFSCPRGGLFYDRWLVLLCFIVLWFLVGGCVYSVGSALFVQVWCCCLFHALLLSFVWVFGGVVVLGACGVVCFWVLRILWGGLLCLGLFYVVCGVVFNLQCVCCCWVVGCG